MLLRIPVRGKCRERATEKSERPSLWLDKFRGAASTCLPGLQVSRSRTPIDEPGWHPSTRLVAWLNRDRPHSGLFSADEAREKSHVAISDHESRKSLIDLRDS